MYVPCQKASWVTTTTTPIKRQQNSVLMPIARGHLLIPESELHIWKDHPEQITWIYSINLPKIAMPILKKKKNIGKNENIYFKVPSEGPYILT